MVLAELGIRTERITTSRGFRLECESADEVITKSLREKGQWEEGVALAIERHLQPGWTFLDVGAHIGYFTTLAASMGNPVIAIEADSKYAEILKRNAPLADIREVAISDRIGTGKLWLDPRFTDNPGAQYLRDAGGAIPVSTLGAVLGDVRPEFIKIDIEGMEYRALKACPEILRDAQVVIFEVGREMCDRYGVTVAEVIQLIEDAGFGVTDINGKELTEEVHRLPSDYYINLLARRGVSVPKVPIPEIGRYSVLLCAWRNMVIETAECLMMLRDAGWSYSISRGDADIARSRDRAASNWYLNTDDDVFLMIDDDVVFEPRGAQRVADLAKEKRGIAVGAYPVKDGSHLACRRFMGQEIIFGPDVEPVKIQWPATGFMAVHRDVLTAMIEAKRDDGSPLFPICDGKSDMPMWTFFDQFVIEHDGTLGPEGTNERLSEDYAFGEQARRLGFDTWLDPTVNLFHMGTYPYCVQNMTTARPVEVNE